MDNLVKKIPLNKKEAKSFFEKQNANKLNDIKIYLDNLYYNSDNELEFPDEIYDILIDVMKKNNILVPSVGAKIREGDNRVKLPYWLGSADKITAEQPEELERWKNKNKSETYIVMDKLDGVSCLFIYDEGAVKLYTRGDGIVGADISYLKPYFKNIPDIKESIVIRGELIIDKKTFETKYKNNKTNERVYKNPRNMVSGLISGKTVRKGLEDIRFVPYEIIGREKNLKIEEQLKHLEKLKFDVVYYERVGKITIPKLIETLKYRKSKSEFEVDGLIIQNNQPYHRNTTGNPLYMFAFKMITEDGIVQTRVKDIEWNISKWGLLKPVVIIDPVDIGGVTINRASAHNAKYIVDNNLGKDSIVEITRSNEVIPYIYKIIKQSKTPLLPDIEYSWDKNNVNIIAKEGDIEMCVKLISSFFANIGVKQVSESTVKKMINFGFSNLMKILSASKEDLMKIPTIEEKSANRIYNNIHNSLKDIEMYKVIGASGILGFGFGERRTNSLFNSIPNILQLYKTIPKEQLKKQILEIDGISDITADLIIKNLPYADLFIKKISKYATFKNKEKISDIFKNNIFVFSGFRDKDLEGKITERNGKVTTSVSGKTTFVVIPNGSKDESGKVKKAKELGIKIIEKNELEKMLN